MLYCYILALLRTYRQLMLLNCLVLTIVFVTDLTAGSYAFLLRLFYNLCTTAHVLHRVSFAFTISYG